MFARALIVLLLVLNLGVATWWALRPAPTPPSATVLPGNAPRLQLLGEVSRHTQIPITVAAPVIAPMTATGGTTAPTPDAAQRCVTFGPFTDAAALANARLTLQPQVTRLQVRQATASGRGWRVWLPSLPDREAAQAMATRIAAAGFKDYYIVSDGDAPNSIALGRYGNEAAAQHQQSALQAAGIPARVEALGGVTNWIDVTATSVFDADSTRRKIGAGQARPLDCTSSSSLPPRRSR